MSETSLYFTKYRGSSARSKMLVPAALTAVARKYPVTNPLTPTSGYHYNSFEVVHTKYIATAFHYTALHSNKDRWLCLTDTQRVTWNVL